jgi:hypothetical protein
MKSILIFLMMAMPVFGITQKIDYQNFDESLATDALENAFIHFRDTFSHLTINPKYKLSEYSVDLANDTNLRKMRWSDFLQKEMSVKNLNEIISTGVFAHPNRKEWVQLNKQKFIDEFYSTKKVSSIDKSQSRVSYDEALYSGKNLVYETYEDLANGIIKSWLMSESHSRSLRTTGYSRFNLKKYNHKLTSLYSVSVVFDKTNNTVYSVLNVIDVQ